MEPTYMYALIWSEVRCCFGFEHFAVRLRKKTKKYQVLTEQQHKNEKTIN